jgi:hypothetical protein
MHVNGALPCGKKSPVDARNNKGGRKPLEEVRVPFRDLFAWFDQQRQPYERWHESDLTALLANWLQLKPVELNSQYMIRFPSLDECRKRIDSRLGKRIEWPTREIVDERCDEQREQATQAGQGPEDRTGWVVEVPDYTF